MGRRTKVEGRILVLGAGVAGVATATALHVAGLDFVVYERRAGMGGVWFQNYPGASGTVCVGCVLCACCCCCCVHVCATGGRLLRVHLLTLLRFAPTRPYTACSLEPTPVQTSAQQYEYPGKKYPEHIRHRTNPPGPTDAEVRDYLTEYCDEQNISNRFEFKVTVTNVAKKQNGDWTVTSSKGTETFAFVVICTGLFSNKPNLLHIPGMDEFKAEGGTVLHTSTWESLAPFHGQRVLIIGNGKSAADAAMAAANVAKAAGTTPPVQVIRQPRWYVPRLLLQHKWLVHSRLATSVLPRYYENDTFAAKLLHALASPVKFLLWRTLEVGFWILLRLPWALWPRWGTLHREGALAVAMLVTDERHLRPIRSGEIDLRVGHVQKLSPRQAHLSNGSVPVDVIVMGTGWQPPEYSFLDPETVRSKLDFTADGLWLYRNILVPQLDGIAFIGANTLSLMNTYSSFVQAFWLIGLLLGHRDYMSEQQMVDNIAREKAFKRRVFPYCNIRGANINSYMGHYLDILLAEQGIQAHVYSGPLARVVNMVMPILPETMAESFAKARLAIQKSR